MTRQPLSPGTVIGKWRVIEFIRRDRYRKAGKVTHSFPVYRLACLNCGIERIRAIGRLNTSGCRNCESLPKSKAGFNRLLYLYQRNCKKQKRAFSLNHTQFRLLTSSPCFYCGLPPSRIITCNANNPGKKSTWGNYAFNGIDRKDNRVGYTFENCVPCCHWCNRAKNVRSFEEFVSYWRGVISRIEGGQIPASSSVTSNPSAVRTSPRDS